MVYKAERDIQVILIPLFMEVIIIIQRLLIKTLNIRELFLTFIFCTIVVAFILSNILTIKYICTEEELIIKTCFYSKRLEYKKIARIERKVGGYSFSASSCNQIRLTYIDKQIIKISPKKIDELCIYLTNVCCK